MPAPDLVALGMDVGGTATRVLVIDATGRRRGAGLAGGGNPTAHQRETWARTMSEALSQALTASGPVEVGSVVAGVAGGGTLAESDAASFEQIIRSQVGRRCRIQVTGDMDIAFAAGTPEPDGTVLVAGTGAGAAAISGRMLVTMADGHGWLLGDSGSGFWIGREAVRAALAALDGRGLATGILPLVIEALLGRDWPTTDARRTCLQIVQAVHDGVPVELSRLAPLVSQCAAKGDQVAIEIAHGAVSHLLSAAEAVRSPGATTPVVVTGSVGVGDHVIATLLHRELERRWPTCVRSVRDGVAGAAWLALMAVLPSLNERKLTDLHRVLVKRDV